MSLLAREASAVCGVRVSISIILIDFLPNQLFRKQEAGQQEGTRRQEQRQRHHEAPMSFQAPTPSLIVKLKVRKSAPAQPASRSSGVVAPLESEFEDSTGSDVEMPSIPNPRKKRPREEAGRPAPSPQADEYADRDEKPHRCPKKGCKRRYATQGNVVRHIKKHHNKGQPFRSWKSLRRPKSEDSTGGDVEMPSPPKPPKIGGVYQRPVCPKTFPLLINYDSHLISHSDEKPHICPFPNCNRRFKRFAHLVGHARHHDDEWYCQWHYGENNALTWMAAYLYIIEPRVGQTRPCRRPTKRW